ncbi:acyl-CoA thioesterase [Phaeacidiphilus oryzae]|uniref:acyl-CoA thioesterase n=1 Tax=Phaeacidiphilus oryzae TaxID=348818 RepID=UPI00055FC72A|nr:acyl-CoA thioesterase II [Phaeacidiphilus oryzae]
MGDAVDQLVDLLDLEQIEVNIFRGRSPEESLQRVFGGQVAGQALVAAGRTVEEGRPVHSLHAYFLRPGMPGVPIVYQVDRLRDGRSFTTRRVLGVQQGKTIFALTADFHKPEEGEIEHQVTMPEVPAPESLPSAVDEVTQGLGAEAVRNLNRRQPFDLRYVNRLRWTDEEIAAAEQRSAVWLRTDGKLGDDPLIHVCAVTYASDLTLLDAVRVGNEPLFGNRRKFDLASLDHAMWFHRPFRADDWLLYTQESPVAGGGRGLGTGQIFDREGRLVVSVVQEGLFRRMRR